MRITLPHLEKAIRSQFVLLSSGMLHCSHVEIKNRGLAMILFVGLSSEWGMDETEVAAYLGITERLWERYYNFYDKADRKATTLINKGQRPHPETLAGKVYNKSGLIKSWLKHNQMM